MEAQRLSLMGSDAVNIDPTMGSSRMMPHPDFEFWVLEFPMPPSINASLRPGFKGRFRKTPEALLFQSACQRFGIAHAKSFNNMNKELSKYLSHSHGLRVDAFFFFPQNKLVTTSKGTKRLKVIDANNRLKAALDGLASCLGIDDRHFIAGNCEKAISKNDKACVHFRIAVEKLKTQLEIEGMAYNRVCKLDA
jgi:hypothetical protein